MPVIVSQSIDDDMRNYQDIKKDGYDSLAAQLADMAKYTNVDNFGAIGDGTNDDTTFIQNAIDSLKNTGGVIQFTHGKTYNIKNSLVLYDNMTIIAYGATLKLTVNGKNMMVNQCYLSTVDKPRNKNITILGGTYDAGATSGSGAQNLRCIFWHVDNLRIRDANYLSTSGKYMIALADTNHVRISDIDFNTGSDGIHLLGKNYDTIIQNLSGTTGDDMVGITTQDYVSYAFDEGEVKNLTIKNVTGSNNTRIVLLGNTKYAITNVIIDNIRQLGTGHLVTIGDGASTDGSVRVDEITITNAYSDNISSWILLQHKNMGKVKVENTTNLIYLSRNATGGSASIEKLIVKNGNSVSADATYTTKMDQVVLENIFGGGIKLSGEKTNVCIRNYVCTIARAAVELNGHTAKIILDNCNLKTTGTGEDHIVSYTGIIDDIEIINSKLYAGGLVTQAAIVGTTSSTSICRKVTINNCETGEHQSIFRGYYSATDITPELVLSNVSITTTNRLVELTAGYNLVLRYNNIKISSPLNELFRGTSGQKLTAYGHGWDCTKTMLVGTITCESYAQDFPVKADLLNKVAKGACYNVNSALTCGIGYLISDGTSWKNLFSGATY